MQAPLAGHMHLGSEEALSFQGSFSPRPSPQPVERSAQQQAQAPPAQPQQAQRAPQRPPGGSTPAPWAPQGVLLAHLAEHTRAVNQLAVLQVPRRLRSLFLFPAFLSTETRCAERSCASCWLRL